MLQPGEPFGAQSGAVMPGLQTAHLPDSGREVVSRHRAAGHIIGHHLDEPGHLIESLACCRQEGQCMLPCGEGQHDEFVPAAQVGALMGDDGIAFGRTESSDESR